LTSYFRLGLPLLSEVEVAKPCGLTNVH